MRPDNETLERWALLERIFSDLIGPKMDRVLSELNSLVPPTSPDSPVTPIIRAVEGVRNTARGAAVEAHAIWETGLSETNAVASRERFLTAMNLLKAAVLALQETVKRIDTAVNDLGLAGAILLRSGALEAARDFSRVADSIGSRIMGMGRGAFDLGKTALIVSGVGLGLWLFFKMKDGETS